MLATQTRTPTAGFQSTVHDQSVLPHSMSTYDPLIAVGWRRVAYLLLAALAFAASVVGVILPGIPTTPFLLLTSYCLVRSSRRLHQRLLASRVFGDLIQNWQQHRRIRRSTRTKAVFLTLAVVTVSLCFGTFSSILLIAMLSGTVIGLTVILSLPVLEG